MDHARAYAPASVSNVACGFDIMGFALDGPGDTVTVRIVQSQGVAIRRITGTSTPLPMDASRNTAGAPVLAMLKHAGTRFGIEIDIHKGLAPGSGIGSSAASAVAAVVATDALLGTGFSRETLLEFALEGEKIASGAVHVDNLAPCLYGGFVLVRGYHPIDIVPIRIPGDLWCTIVHPHVEIRTKESRMALPGSIHLQDVVRQTGNAAGLIAGLLTSNFGLIGRALEDVIAEPTRGPMIPGFLEMKAAARDAGALGCSISGSGPSVFALTVSREGARAAGEAMAAVLDRCSCPHSLYISCVGAAGSRVLDKESDDSD